MTETNLNITRVENGFIVDAGTEETVSVAETASSLTALVASWARQFEPAEPVTPGKPALEVVAGRFYADENGAVVGPMLPMGDVFIEKRGDGRSWWRDGKTASSFAKFTRLVAEVEQPAPTVRAPAPLVIREHGIYERRDGAIVGPMQRCKSAGDSGEACLWKDAADGYYYQANGVCPPGLLDQDLIREIVVGEGWLPWNGGECPVDHLQMVDLVMRNVPGLSAAKARIYRWDHCQDPGDILAYRPSTEG